MSPYASPVIVGDEVDGDTEVTISSWSADSVQVRLCMLGEVKVDDHIHCLNIDTSRE